MAYGVKYELLFSDVKGNRRKIQILKNGYSGAVFPIIGTENPIEIEWLTDDDIYEPIIGSVATINMFVTDSVSYDDFYQYGEREYQLVLLYESSPSVFSTYWKGWITNDIYSQAIVTNPYVVSIRATDGLGTLNGFDSWYPEIGENTQLVWKWIWKNLQLTGLDFDIWISCDLRYSTSSWENVFNQISIYKEAVFKNNYTIRDAKDILRSILIAFNCRIFQSYGTWYICNASTYGDQRIIAGIQNGTYSGSGILAAKQAFLASGSEEIKFFKYDKNGNLLGNVTQNKINYIPQWSTAVGADMMREIKRPLRRYQENINIEQKPLDYNYNASFEFLDENWDFVDGVTFSDDPFSGKRSAYQSITEPTDTLAVLSFKSINNKSVSINDTGQILISVKCSVPSGSKLPYYVKISNGVNNWYAVNGEWTDSGTILWNYLSLEDHTQWQEFKITTKNFPEAGVAEIGIGRMQTVGGVSATMLYDNIAFRNNSKQTNEYKEIQYIRDQNASLISSDKMEHNEIYFSNIIGQYFWGNFENYPNFKRCNDTSFKQLEEIITQQRLNDYQSYLKTYEATIYPLYGELTMANKIFINFANFTETDSCLIDAIKYNVKQNRYEVRMHIPNNYQDVASTFRASYID